MFNTTVSKQGLSMGFLHCAAGCLAVFALPGILICALTHTIWYNPLTFVSSSAGGYFLLVFVCLPVALGAFLNSYKVQGYRLVDYIKLYLEPKIPIDHSGKRVKISAHAVDAFMERL